MPRSHRKFDIDEFVRECLEAWEADGADAVKDVLDRTLGRGCAPVRVCFGDPHEAHLQVLYPGPELVIENMVWAPGMSYPAHNHNTPVMTGVYSGLEVNDFYNPAPEAGGRLHRTRTVDLAEGDAVLMGYDAIHRIANPNRRSFTGAFHIYMGDYLHSSRSIWYPDEALETPSTFATTKEIFAAANRDLAAARVSEAEPERRKKRSAAERSATKASPVAAGAAASGTAPSGSVASASGTSGSASSRSARKSTAAKRTSRGSRTGTASRPAPASRAASGAHLHPPGDQG